MSYTPGPAPSSRPSRSTASTFTALGVLVALNVGAFAIQLASSPFDDTLDGSLAEHGGLNGWEVDHGDWYRIFTSAFLHANAAHLFGNLVALVILGGVLTLAAGPLRMVLVYATGLLGSAFSVLAFAPETLTVGASGAIFGLAGGALVVGWRQRRVLLLIFAAGWTVYALSSTLFVPGISQAGHLGGLVAGGIAGWLLVGERAQLRSESAAAGLVAALLVALFVGALVV
ncbi:rhomboid family intramembrane serine protease [Conexibacter woesei]|uniref:Rhomboid family protein n=1 Tax=Conexibacter woesei (strain DSM 14684 / CCUG 47730 / CIP 108061 / JCM 11494 / NBRC 100937 / ID131577) TaxID=469383 RepID=D3F0P5_CONWI|nr:rhomboid family intramembrane serine protease [Conexibacter woesei]ADB53979.1 Rhomboid family protein [Conexibacter woesei DSM 14684]